MKTIKLGKTFKNKADLDTKYVFINDSNNFKASKPVGVIAKEVEGTSTKYWFKSNSGVTKLVDRALPSLKNNILETYVRASILEAQSQLEKLNNMSELNSDTPEY